MTDPSEVYTEAWYRENYDDGLQRPAVVRQALALVEIVKPINVFDVGCGPGVLVGALRVLGVDAWGCDGSRHALALARVHLGQAWTWRADLRDPDIFVPNGTDTIVCTEVAEHLEAPYAEQLVDHLCRAGRRIVFTSAPPGQGGLDHVNEQPPGYWLDKFEARGWVTEVHETLAIREAWRPLTRLSHLSRNGVVLKKGTSNG